MPNYDIISPMKGFFYFFIFLTLLFYSQVAFTPPALAGCSITQTLRIGSKGAEVKCLQSVVGVSQDGKFGPLTKSAVKAFQSNNVLAVDGIVGPLTRAALFSGDFTALEDLVCPNGMTLASNCAENSIPLSSDSFPSNTDSVINNIDEKKELSQENTENINPNLENMDQFIENVVAVSRQNGSSESELALIADSLKKEILESGIDYKKKFEETLTNDSKLSTNLKNEQSPTIFKNFVHKTLSFLGISPSVAYAAIGVQFGGFLTFPFFCAYNVSWMLNIVLPSIPPRVYILTYYPGTQGFASYNIPFTGALLGAYIPPGVCVIPGGFVPIIIPTMGTITPTTGSSPSPR